eukprot:5787678-Pleurochrysis_carterae.AAC.1
MRPGIAIGTRGDSSNELVPHGASRVRPAVWKVMAEALWATSFVRAIMSPKRAVQLLMTLVLIVTTLEPSTKTPPPRFAA